MASVSTKLNIEGSNNDAKERFCDMYKDPASGKRALINDFLSAGTILKEAGLLDLVLNLDKNLEFRKAPNTAKTRMLLVELGDLFAGVQAPVDTVKTEQPAAVEERQPEPAPVDEPASPSRPVFESPAKAVAPRVVLPDNMLGS